MFVFCMKICKVVTGSNASFVVNFVVNSRVFADTPKSSPPLMFLSRHESTSQKSVYLGFRDTTRGSQVVGLAQGFSSLLILITKTKTETPGLNRKLSQVFQNKRQKLTHNYVAHLNFVFSKHIFHNDLEVKCGSSCLLSLSLKLALNEYQGSMGDHTIEPLFSGLNSLCCRYTTRWSP